MPCLEWSAEEVEWEQGSGPKGPMSCRTQGWISLRPEKAYFRPLGQFSMIFNGSYISFYNFLLIFHVIQWEFHFLSIFYVIQLQFCNFCYLFLNFPCYWMGYMHFSIFCNLSMLFNGKVVFCRLPMLFNGKFAFCHFPMLFNGNLRIEKLWGGTYGRTDVRKFTPLSYRT